MQDLSQDWAPICCILPKRIKPILAPINKAVNVIVKLAKFLKARKPRKSAIIKPDKDELKLIHMNAGYRKIRLTWIELAWLKTFAVKQGIDDWISLIDSKLSYAENKLNLQQQFGTIYNDTELMQKYIDASDMAQDYYQDNEILHR